MPQQSVPSQPSDERSPRVHREVVSFVRRSARMNPSQQKAWESWHDQLVIDVVRRETSTSVAAQPAIDWASHFGRTAPLCVEIGVGTGENLAAVAAARPDWDFVGFEVFEPALASTLGRLGRARLTNVRLLCADAAQGLEHLFTSGSVNELLTFFPDPWHKKRHHKRRLVSTDFATLVSSRLAPGGLWRLATDWDDYAEWMREVLDAHPGLTNVHPDAAGWAPRWELRPLTAFENKGRLAGRTIHDLTYRRTDEHE